MKCPVCNNSDSRVLDSRPIEDGSSIKRRRECPSCGKRFTTYEVIETVAINVVKRNGSREFFDANKLAHGIERACQKRPVDPLAIAKDIETELQNELVEETKFLIKKLFFPTRIKRFRVALFKGVPPIMR